MYTGVFYKQWMSTNPVTRAVLEMYLHLLVHEVKDCQEHAKAAGDQIILTV